MSLTESNLIWLDLEMTGLNPEYDRIIEIATVITDSELNVVAEGPVFAIHHSDMILTRMDDWNVKQHGKTGLTDRVRRSRISTAKAEAMTLEFLAHYVHPGKSPMCGNTIGQDRRFLCKMMPKLEKFFHYRNLDVTTLKILAQRWQPEVAKGFRKKSKHRALDDIYDSITELQYYRQYLFK